jgi:hypothetical protein
MTDFNTFLAKAINNLPSTQKPLAEPEWKLELGQRFFLEGERFDAHVNCFQSIFGIRYPHPGAVASVTFSRLPPPGKHGFSPLLEGLSEIFSGEPDDFSAIHFPGRIDVSELMDFYRKNKCALILAAAAYAAWNSSGANRNDQMGIDGWSKEVLYGMKFKVVPGIIVRDSPAVLLGPAEVLGPLTKKFIVTTEEG